MTRAPGTTPNPKVRLFMRYPRTPVNTGILIALLTFVLLNNAAADEKADKKQADTVNKTWVVTDPVAKIGDKKIAMKAEIDKANGTVTLANRALLTTKSDYKAGCTVKFGWQWMEGHPQYPDHLAIVLRSGKQDDVWPYEITEGLVVKLNPAGKGIVTIHKVKAGSDPEELARNKDDCEFGQGTNYEIEVTDSGDKITVKVGDKVVVETKVEKGGGKVSVYNREPVANVRHVSVLNGLTVEALPKKK